MSITDIIKKIADNPVVQHDVTQDLGVGALALVSALGTGDAITASVIIGAATGAGKAMLRQIVALIGSWGNAHADPPAPPPAVVVTPAPAAVVVTPEVVVTPAPVPPVVA